MGSGSLGLQIGAKVSEIVFIIRTEGPERHARPQVRVRRRGRRDHGRGGHRAGRRLDDGRRCRHRGLRNSAVLFAGVSLEGSYLDADSDWNALYYGQGATTRAIVPDRRYSNPGAEPIRKYLAQW